MAGEQRGAADPQARLEEYRRQIDQIDYDLVQLLNRRAELAIQVGKLKAGADVAVFHPEREAVVLRQVAEANNGPLPNEALRNIYREVLSSSRALQRPLRVAYFGPAASFTHQAAQHYFGSASQFVACRTIADVFQETSKGNADYGVVPVENSTEGVVNHTLDLLVDTDLQICAEIERPIQLMLVSHGRLDQIRRVYSHPQPLGQSRRWLAEHLPGVEFIEATSTAQAVKLATDPESAAICSALAAELYNVPIIAERIEDVANNVTRFFVIGRTPSKRTGNDRTAIVFSVRDRVGALHDALEAFARHGVNLARIESRPSKRRLWDYVFFIDLVGHPDDPAVAQALAELTAECSFLRVLGTWSAG